MASTNTGVALTPARINSGIQRMFEDKFSEVGTYVLTVKLLHRAWLCMLNPHLPAQTRCLCMQLDVLQAQRHRQVQPWLSPSF